MLIEHTLKRDEDKVLITMPGKNYVFARNKDGKLVADVQIKQHIARFLSIRCYRALEDVDAEAQEEFDRIEAARVAHEAKEKADKLRIEKMNSESEARKRLHGNIQTGVRKTDMDVPEQANLQESQTTESRAQVEAKKPKPTATTSTPRQRTPRTRRFSPSSQADK